MLAEKNRAWVADAFESFFGHRKNAYFVHSAKAVFDRAHQAVSGVGVAFEVENSVNHMLQHPRTRQSTFFGHVSDQYHRRASSLCHAGEVRRTFAHLRDGAWRACQLV